MVSVCGNCRPAAVIAACTSCAAASMLRLRSNCSVIEVEPSVLVEVICVTPAIWPNWRSSGAATVAAMVSGLAPGSCAETEMVGKSTCGSGATGSSGNATMPTSASAADQQRGRDRPADEGFGDVHEASPAAAGLRGAGLGVDARAGLQAILAVDDDALAGRQALGSRSRCRRRRSRLERALLGGVVGLDHPGVEPVAARAAAPAAGWSRRAGACRPARGCARTRPATAARRRWESAP